MSTTVFTVEGERLDLMIAGGAVIIEGVIATGRTITFSAVAGQNTIASNDSIPAGYCALRIRKFTIASGKVYSIGLGGILRVL